MKNTIQPEQVELMKTVAKSLINGLPGGGWLIEFSEIRSRIKQERLNKFVELLQKYFQNSGTNKYHFDLLSDENFTDILEGVLKRVTQTKSIEKMERFKFLLLNQVISQDRSMDSFETFLDLTLRLHEKQIEILSQYEQLAIELNGSSLIEVNNIVKGGLHREKEFQNEGKSNQVNEFQQKLAHFLEKRHGIFYGVTEEEYMFFIQDMVSKSLLIDSGNGGIEAGPYEVVEITTFGKRYLQFIKSDL